jgi:hypothetical protein
MGVTVMIIMGLLSVLAISSIDFDQFDEIRARIEEARAEQENQEEVFEDTSELGWLDVPDNLLTFATTEADVEAEVETKVEAVAAQETTGEEAEDDLFDDIFANDTELDPELSADATYGLWPFEEQSDEANLDADLNAEDAKDGELIELATYDPMADKIAKDIPPKGAVANQNGVSELDVNEDALVQTASSDFKGLEPEDEQLQLAA